MPSPHAIFRSCRTFRVAEGEVPEGFRESYSARLAECAFRTPISATSKEASVGWCQYGRPLQVDISDSSVWLHNPYALLSLRTDQKKVPPKLLRAKLDDARRAWCAEHQRERCPSATREELKEQIELVLLKQSLPSMKLTDAVWNIQEGYVVIAGTSDSSTDRFRKHFRRTFGLGLEEDVLGVSAGGDAECIYFPDPASDFLLWLLWRGAEGRVVRAEQGDVTFWVDGAARVDGFRCAEVGPELLTALAREKAPERLTLAIRCADREHLVRLDGLRVTGEVLPVAVKTGDVEEQLYDAAFLHEECRGLLGEIHRAFLAERTTSGAQHRRAVERWLGKGLEPVEAFLARLREAAA